MHSNKIAIKLKAESFFKEILRMKGNLIYFFKCAIFLVHLAAPQCM